MRNAPRLLISVLLAATFLAPSALAEPRTLSATYVGSVVTMCARGLQPLDVGSACFSLEDDDPGRPATLRMMDAVLGGVAAGYWYQRGSEVIERGVFCGSVETTIPAGATIVLIFSAAPGTPEGHLACPVLSGAGTISATIG